MDPATLSGIMGLFTTAGPASILGLMWFLERTERRQSQKESRLDQEKWLNALNNSASVVNSLRDLITAGGRRE